MELTFTPTLKQYELFETFGNHQLLEILFGGAAGGGKSFAVWSLAIIKCIEFAGIRVGVARHTLTQIKANSYSTFLEVTKKVGITEDMYKYNQIAGTITFFNGSQISFYELRYLPSDQDYDRFGGALLTFGIIEEAAGTDQRGKDVFSSRLGRWMNDEYNIPPHLYLTTNPGINYVYSDFYIPSIKEELAKFRYYIPSKISDNKFISGFYEDALRSRLGEDNAARLVDGDWNFDSDNARLMTYKAVADVFESEEQPLNGDMYISADIAFTSDRCMILIWKGLTILKTIMMDKNLEPEKEIERLAKEYNVPSQNIVYDADGVGKYLKQKLPQAYDFINNSKPLNGEKYENLKAQVHYKLAELINNGSIKCLDQTHKDSAIQELYEIKSKPLDSTEGKLGIISKKVIKQVLGRSPDISDAVAFRMVFELKKKINRPFSLGK